jgi:hypothetical protein
VDTYLALGMTVLVSLLVLALVGTFFLRHLTRRGSSLRHLLLLADRLEADLKACRARLQQAHAVMSLNPDTPAASEQEATLAIEAGLRAVLQQRIWIRDEAPRARLRELDAAGLSMDQMREKLAPLLQALGQAQRELDSAMREHIRQEPLT